MHIYRTADIYASTEMRPEGLWGRDILIPGTVALIAGQAGVGKSFIAQGLGDAVAQGISFAGLQTKQSTVLYCHEEMCLGEVAERVRLMISEQTAMNHPVYYAVRMGLRIDTPDGRDKIRNAAAQVGAKLIILDSLSDFHRQPENSNELMGAMLRELRNVADKSQACILLIHHSGKPKDSDEGSEILRGASSLRDVASDILVVSETEKYGRRLMFKKIRHGPRPDAIPFDIEREIDGGVLVKFQSLEGDL